MEYQVHRNDVRPPASAKLTIEGENLIQAVKDNFKQVLKVSSYHHVPFRYPMTVTPAYNKGIIGGKGGVELKLEWMYSDHLNKPETLHTHNVWIYAQESNIEDTTPFVILGN